ncbi:oxidoreductase [Georgenia deserti]|uniref:Oxidoreductase n=1 Tax=Georgenia deserti TaxID=2093781 RepID=A0ABW4L0F2_9MICO
MTTQEPGEATLYDHVGGFDALLAVVRRWHELCLADPVAAHPFARPLHRQHDERLAAYLAQALGGPALYTAGYGDESFVQRLHAGNGEGDALQEACLRLFDVALDDVGVPVAAARDLSAYFREAASAMRAYQDDADLVPDDLPFRTA